MPKPLFARRVLVVSPTPTYPLNFGNRIRIYEMSKRFQDAGAKVDFLYSPMEWNTSFIDFEGYRQMVKQWDRVFLVPSESKYYTRPQGSHYTIDEWWEAPLQHMLEWLLLRQYYDSVIVNYSFLSKALEIVRGATLRVLDTHDQLAGRKEVFKKLGLQPDFFYLTKEEESKALNRADVVVAIKQEEADSFRTYTRKPIITYPYPGLSQSWVYHGARSVEDVNLDLLRVGFAGGINQFNINCIRGFIGKTRDLFSQRVAPLMILVGGSLCEAIEDLSIEPHVKLLGRYDEPREFYSQCDLIINPMLDSTGLKIKTVEAVSLGMPLLSTAHASEGLPERCSPLLFADDWELAKELVEVSFDRSRLEGYQKASNQALISLQRQASKAFEGLIDLISSTPAVLIISSPQFDIQSDYRRLWLNTLVHYLRHGREVCLTTTTGIIPSLETLKKAYGWQTECVKFIGEAGHESVSDHFFVADLTDLCLTRISVSCVFAAIPTKEQLILLISSLTKLKSVLILEELCDKDELSYFLELLKSNGIKSVIVTSRLGVNPKYLDNASDVIRLLPYRYVDDLRDFFLFQENADFTNAYQASVNKVAMAHGKSLELSQFMHTFQQNSHPIYPTIKIDEYALINMFSFILLLRMFGANIVFCSSDGASTFPTGFFLGKFISEDPCYIFDCMNRNDAGWCEVWSLTK